MTLILTLLGLLVGIALPVLCQIYALLAGYWTIFSVIPLILGHGSHVGVYGFNFQPVLPFTVINPFLSNFWIGWGLLVASRKSKSITGFILGGLIVLLMAPGWLMRGMLFGDETVSLIFTSFLQFGYGAGITDTILAGWKEGLAKGKPP